MLLTTHAEGKPTRQTVRGVAKVAKRELGIQEHGCCPKPGACRPSN